MSELNQRYKSLMKTIESKIKDEEDLKEVKEKLSSLVVLFMDKIDKIMNVSEDKVQALLSRQKGLEERIDRIETIAKNIEKDIYLDDNYDFEIVCPYCNSEFVTEFDELDQEIHCPECNNIIELDWSGGEEGSCCEHSGCHHCKGHEDPQEEEEHVEQEAITEEEDDM